VDCGHCASNTVVQQRDITSTNLETTPALSRPLQHGVRRFFNYQVKIFGTLRDSQPYEFTVTVQAEKESDAINNAIQFLPSHNIPLEGVHMAKAKIVSF